MLIRESINRRLLPERIGKWLKDYDSSDAFASYSWTVEDGHSWFSLNFTDTGHFIDIGLRLESLGGSDIILYSTNVKVLSEDKTVFVEDFVREFSKSRGFWNMTAFLEEAIDDPVLGVFKVALNMNGLYGAFKKAISTIKKDMDAIAVKVGKRF